MKLIEAGRLLQGFTASDEPIILENAGVLVEGGAIREIGPIDALRLAHPQAEPLGGPGMVVMPGLINAHHHVGLTPLQLGSPDHPLELWFASRMGLRDVDPRLDTLFSAFEMIESGVTTVQHLHSRIPGGPDAQLATAEAVTGAYAEIGLRASFSIALRDQNRLVYEDDRAFTASLPEALRPAMAAWFERFTLPLTQQIEVFQELRRRHAGEPLLGIQLAPANLHWLSDAALEDIARLAAETGLPLHMHLLETPYQRDYARRRTGSAVAHLARLGLSGPKLTLGHGVWLDEGEIEACAHAGTRLCHNCSSNFRLKSGLAPLNRFLAAGIPVALGLDEAGINDDRDMLQEMRLVLRVHRAPGHDAPCPSPAQVLRMASEHGAATTPFAGRIGRLFPDMAADLVMLDWRRLTWPYQDVAIPLVDVLVQRAKREAISAVMIGGELVYREGRFTRIDREAVLAEIAGRLAKPLTEAESLRRSLSEAVLPHVRRFYAGYLSEN